MAIGDAVIAYLGTAAENHQPSSGVEEQISSIVKKGNTDAIAVYHVGDDQALEILDSLVRTRDANPAAANQTGQPAFNIAIMITNSICLRKVGTTDIVYCGGVQTNA